MSEPPDRLRSALADRYRLESELGAGGMATVHLATDLKHRRKVAVKVLRTERGSAAGRDRFLREIETLGHLRHPHILPLLDSGSIDELCFFVMPYCEGETLRDRLAREGQLPIDEAVQYAREIAEALDYAHRHGVIHRDVKPQNIMVESGHAVLADFGIALSSDARMNGGRLTQTGHSPGTPQYMSPEQAATDPRLDARSDIYSLGCVLYEMLVGQPPFTGPTLRAILARHAIEPPPSIRVVRETVSQALEEVVFQALAKAPADRFSSAGEFAHALEAVARDRVRQTAPSYGTTTFRTPTESTEVVRPSTGVLLLRFVAAVGFALIMLTAIGFLTIRAFDIKVGMPARVSPSRADYLTVGIKALIGPFVIGSLLVLGFMVVNYVARFVHGALTHFGAMGRRIQNAANRFRIGWFGLWETARPDVVADCFFVAAVISAALMLLASTPLLSAHFTTETAIFGCDHRPWQRSTNVATAGLIFALGFAWRGVFGWLRRRHGPTAAGGLAKWGSAAVIMLLVLVVTLPWRLMWAGGDERVLVDGQRGYLLRETNTHVILHNAERRTTTAYALDELPPLQRLGVTGHVFEEPAAFHSGAQDCTGTY